MKKEKTVCPFYLYLAVFILLLIKTATCFASPADIDFGLEENEQQGGSGLLGETVRILNGNVIEYRSDFNFSSPNRLGLSFGATYNSKSTISGVLGYGWTHSYQMSLNPSCSFNGLTYLQIIDSAGKGRYFLQDTTDHYEGAFAERTYVALASGEYVWHRLDGSTYGFNLTGRISWIKDAAGNRINLAYDTNSRLSTVTDASSGRVLTFYYNASNLIDYITGPVSAVVTDGKWVSYGYDANNNLASVLYADGSGFDYSYADINDIHNLTEKSDKADHLINTWGYDSSDRAISNFSRDGKGVDIVYVSDNQIQVTDAYDKLREYILIEVADRKRVSAITDGISGAGSFPYSDSNVVSWVYDDQMRPIEMNTERDITTQYSDYDERENPRTVTLASGTDDERILYYTYHPFINTPLTRTEASVLGAGDKVTIWDYDNDYDTTPNESPTALVSRIIEQGFTKDASGSVISYEYVTTINYNSKGQITTINGPLAGTSDTTTFTYNSTTGNLLTIVRPLIGTTTFASYDAAGQAGTVTDINSRKKTYTYDGKGRVTVTTNNADSSTSSVVYNNAGLVESQTDEDSVTTTFSYDPTYGRLSKRTDSQGNYISYTYDDQGNITGKDYYDSLNVKSNSKSYLYVGSNLPGLLYKEIDGDGAYTQYEYDLDGNISSVKDPNGNITTYTYDSMNRLIIVAQPGSIITQYAYDGQGNLQSVIDANNHTTTYQYDDMARLVSTTSPDTGTVTYAYDEAGNPTNKRDAKSLSINYTYDVLNRLKTVDFPNDGDITFTYDTRTDGKGHLYGIADSSGYYYFYYDVRGRLVRKDSWINGYQYMLTRTFTPGGRINKITYPSGRIINYNRTECACKVDSITTVKGTVTTTLVQNLSYRPFGGMKSLDNGAGGTVGSAYNESGRLAVSNPGSEHQRTYTYDNNGNIQTITAGSTPEAYYNRSYEYDALNRITHATGPWGDVDYTYDNVGNRLTSETDTSFDTYNYVSGTNILDTITGTNATTFTHDGNGNITGIGSRTFTYNDDNRLVAVADGGTTLGQYVYNALGQRAKKTVEGITYHLLYDFDGNLIEESYINLTFLKEYLYNGSNRLAMVDVPRSKIYYYGNDQLGTPEILTDSTNTVVWEAIYKPFGEAEVNAHSTVVNNFRFPGQYYDQETGLHYNYHRYYDPSTGRYLTPDPIGQLGNFNLFTYSNNNPVNLSDIFGLYTEVVVWQPVGWGTSSFGHVSVIINGTSYSFGPNGMDIRPADEYLSKNTFREGIGSVLDLCPCEEKKFEDYLKKYNEDYFWPMVACVTPINEGLKSIGYDIGKNLFPVSLGNALIDSGLANSYNFYEASQPRKGSSAPWTK